jgi:hypothetical protein
MRDVWNTSGSVIRQLAANLSVDADGLADVLNDASDAKRERLLTEADAPLQAKLEQQRYQAAANSSDLEHREDGGYALLACAEPDCAAFPLGDHGEPRMLNIRRWWCERHRHLSQPEDDTPWSPGFGYDPQSGALLDLERDRVERAQAERDEQRLAAQRANERAEREAEAALLGPDDNDAYWQPSGPGWTS